MTPPVCKTERIKFDLIQLTAEQVKRNVLPGDFDESRAMKLGYHTSSTVRPDIDPKTGKKKFTGIVMDVNEEGSLNENISFKGLRGNEANLLVVSEGYNAIHNISKDRIGDKGLQNSSLLFMRNRSIRIQIDDHQCSLDDGICWAGTKFAFETSLILSGRVYVQSANSGDYNADGLTDIILRLSDGGAYIIQQREKVRKVKVCEST